MLKRIFRTFDFERKNIKIKINKTKKWKILEN